MTLRGLNLHVAALLLVTLVWGATFPILKMAAAHLSGVEISGLRFLIAGVCMLPFTVRAPRRTWRDGAVLGVLALVSYVAQAYGLQHISSNRSAFLTSLNVLMVPLLGMAIGTRPSTWVWLSSGLVCMGMGLMSWDGGSHLLADSATVLAALLFALYVMVLSHLARHHDARQLAATQIVWMAGLGLLWMVSVSGGVHRLVFVWQQLHGVVLVGLLYLGLVATAGMFFLQAYAQRHVAAEQAAVIYAMEPVFATVFAWAWLSEVLTLQAAVGGALVVGAVVLSGCWPHSPVRNN